MKGLFLRSIENKEKIIIFYVDSKNIVSQRYIRVIRMNEDSIVAFCYWRKKIRTFNMQNILSAGAPSKNIGAS
jgi:predicted DNA-binding transcriptional regulator YafY